MPCEVCGLYPTWADLSDCEKPECPWKLDLWKPIPRLADMHRNPPPTAPVAGPSAVKVTNKPKPLLSVLIPDTPQPHSFGASLDQRMTGMTPMVMVAEPAPPVQLTLAQRLALNPGPMKPLAKPVVAVASAAAPAPKPAIKLSKTASEDYDLIMKGVDDMNWSGDHGPEVPVTTRLKWADLEGRSLYLKVKQDLHDVPFSVGEKTLYFYVTALAPPLKAGFRITGHSKKSNAIGKSKTYGVLHIVN